MRCALILLLICLRCFTSAETAHNLSREVPPDGYRAQYGYVLCRADEIVRPGGTAEVVTAIKQFRARAEAEGRELKIRMSRNLFHSSSVFPCPNQLAALGPDGNSPAGPARASGVLSVALLNDRMAGVLVVDRERHRLRVGAGMDLNGLFKHATENGMSVVPATLPAYAGLTLGGILSTSSHGTGDRRPSALIDMVQEATWVDSRGEVHTASREGSPEEFRALNGGLGLMGVVTELLLQLTPPTNTQLRTVLDQPDDDIYGLVVELLKRSPHVLVFWRPDLKRFSAFLTGLAPPGMPANDSVSMTLLPDLSKLPSLRPGFQMWQADIWDNDPFRQLMCEFPPPVPVVQALTVRKAFAQAGGRFGQPVYDAVAPTNQMQSAECDQNCLWNGPQFGGTSQDAEFTVEFTALESWVTDVKRIFREDLWMGGTRTERCQGGGYIWLRFGQGTDDYLATTQGMSRPVYLQSTWMRSTDIWQYPMRYGYVPELIELMTLCKYKGRPHWGKNWDRTFTYPACPIRPRYPLFDDMISLQSKVDPSKVFEPPLFSKVAAGQGFDYYPGCATNYECYCQEDAHCAPEFKCVPSKALPEFKVCKPPSDTDPKLISRGTSNMVHFSHENDGTAGSGGGGGGVAMAAAARPEARAAALKAARATAGVKGKPRPSATAAPKAAQKPATQPAPKKAAQKPAAKPPPKAAQKPAG